MLYKNERLSITCSNLLSSELVWTIIDKTELVGINY